MKTVSAVRSTRGFPDCGGARERTAPPVFAAPCLDDPNDTDAGTLCLTCDGICDPGGSPIRPVPPGASNASSRTHTQIEV